MPLSKKDVTPAAEELAAEKGIDVNQVEGTGEGGKVTKADVDALPDADPGKQLEDKPDPADVTPEVPPEGSPAAETPSGYALRVSGGDPDAYAKARAEKRYGIGGS